MFSSPRPVPARAIRFGRFLTPLALALLLVACGSTGSSQGSSSGGMAGMHMTSSLPAWASSLKLHIVSPSNGTVVTGNDLPLQLSFSGYTPDCLTAGTPVKRGTGHYHLYLDNRLISMFCSADVDLSMQNVQPGRHTVTAEPSLNDHQVVTANAVHLVFEYKPAAPLPWVSPAPASGQPAIKIVSPAAGSTITGTAELTVQVSNFQLSCPLQGKVPVAGTGDWVLNHDSLQGGSEGMATMVRISCVDTITVSAAGLRPGQHTFIATLANDDGTTAVPLVSDQIVLVVA